MTGPSLHHASYRFLVQTLVPSAVQQNTPAVLAHFDQFVQAYDPGQAKSRQWVDVDYDAVHQWVESNSSTPAQFSANWALAASAVFFRYDGGSSTAGIPDPCPGCWDATPLQAQALNSSGQTAYEWVYDSNTNQWVRICIDVQGLVPTDPSPPVYPEVVVGGQVIAVVRASLRYVQEVVAAGGD